DPQRRLNDALDLPNAVWRLLDAKPAWTRCLLLAMRFTAISDEQREGLIWLGFNQGTGAALQEGVVAGLRARLAGDSEWRVPEPDRRQAAAAAFEAASISERLRWLIEEQVQRDLEPFLRAMRRRLERDRDRVYAYHDTLRQSAQAKLQALSGAAGD